MYVYTLFANKTEPDVVQVWYTYRYWWFLCSAHPVRCKYVVDLLCALTQLLVRLPPEHMSGCFNIHACNIYTTIYNVLFHLIINVTYFICFSGFSTHEEIRLFSLYFSLFSRIHNYETRADLSFCLDFFSTQKLLTEIL